MDSQRKTDDYHPAHDTYVARVQEGQKVTEANMEMHMWEVLFQCNCDVFVHYKPSQWGGSHFKLNGSKHAAVNVLLIGMED